MISINNHNIANFNNDQVRDSKKIIIIAFDGRFIDYYYNSIQYKIIGRTGANPPLWTQREFCHDIYIIVLNFI